MLIGRITRRDVIEAFLALAVVLAIYLLMVWLAVHFFGSAGGVSVDE